MQCDKKFTGFVLFLGILLISCSDSKYDTNQASDSKAGNGPPKAVFEFFQPFYNQLTADLIAVRQRGPKGPTDLILADPLTGRPIPPCRPQAGKGYEDSALAECKTRVEKTNDGEFRLFRRNPDGSEQELKILNARQITVLEWEGSYCNTTFSGGSQYESCISLEQVCAAAAAAGITLPDCA